MAEELAYDLKLKNGSWQLYIDQEKKLFKWKSTGKWENDEFANVTKISNSEMVKRFKKGEAFLLNDATSFTMRLFSPVQMKQSSEMSDFYSSYCKKVAVVVPSFVLRKGFELIAKENLKFFATAQEGESWLMKN